MTSIDSLVTIAVAVVSSGGLWGFLQFVVGRRSEAARQVAERERQETDRAKLLAAAQRTAQETALTSYHDANDLLRRQCSDCQLRLSDVESDLRITKAALRATVRALDKNDPAQVDAAITAARELI